MSSNKVCVVRNNKYELVPPDGGWGYMIWISAIINYSATTMFIGCFGIIFNDLLKELDLGSTSVTLLGGINAMSLAIAGYFTSPLLKVMSIRKLAFLASFLFNLGAFCTIFVKSTLALFICQGPLQFSGFGILYSLSCTQINEYFLQKRLLSISLTQTMSAVAAMVAPQFVKWSLGHYGFRGTLILISGISLQTFVAVTLMQPVYKHMRRVEITGNQGDEMKLLIVDKKATTAKIATPVITLTDTESSFDGNIGVKADIPAKLNVEGNNTEVIQMISEIVDIKLLKQFLLSAASMGPTYSLFAEGIFVLMLPQALYSMGWDQDTVAKAITLTALGDLVTRVLFICLSKWLSKIGSHEIYLMGLFVALVSRLGMLWAENRTLVMIFITIMGVSHCTITVLPPLIFADSYKAEQFTSVLGIFMLVLGLMNLIIGPAIGAVRDLTDSYPTVFYIITSCFAVVLLLWSIELCYKRNRHKRRLQRELAEKTRRRTNTNKGK